MGHPFDDDDIYLRPLCLPMEEQRGSTLEERLALVDKRFDECLDRLSGKVPEDKPVVHPLTTDVIGRGYPVRKEELEAIRKINEAEQKLLCENPDARPADEGYTYYIAENGHVFKTKDDIVCYELQDDMTWKGNVLYTSVLYDTFLKFSKLANFRDYYPIVK